MLAAIPKVGGDLYSVMDEGKDGWMESSASDEHTPTLWDWQRTVNVPGPAIGQTNLRNSTEQ